MSARPTAILEVWQHNRPAGGVPAFTSTVTRRQLRGAGVRLAVNLPELGKTIELTASEQGLYSVKVGPAPGRGGPFVTVFDGDAREEV